MPRVKFCTPALAQSDDHAACPYGFPESERVAVALGSQLPHDVVDTLANKLLTALYGFANVGCGVGGGVTPVAVRTVSVNV